jgi:hypothetical protein
MLKLVYFLPCEKLIISEDGLVTIVNILDGLNVEEDEKLVESAAIPFQWEVITLWFKENEEDSEKPFEQKLELFYPNRKTAFTSIVPFATTSKESSFRLINKVGAFPVGITGTLWLKLSIRYAGEQNQWNEVAQYPLAVKHITKSEENRENKIPTENEKSIESI